MNTKTELKELAIKEIEQYKDNGTFELSKKELVDAFSKAFEMLGFQIVEDGTSYFVIPKPTEREEYEAQMESAEQDHHTDDGTDNGTDYEMDEFHEATFITNTDPGNAKLWVKIGEELGETIHIGKAYNFKGTFLANLVSVQFAEEPESNMLRRTHERFAELKRQQ